MYPKNCNGKSFLTITLIIAFAAIVLKFLTLQFFKITIEQNQDYAQETLKLFSTAVENFAKDHNGAYPAAISELLKSQPAYIDRDYITNPSNRKGYIYACPRLEPTGYRCSATPVRCGLTGKKSYQVTTGGAFLVEECAKDDKD
jgi:hypothetical protein